MAILSMQLPLLLGCSFLCLGWYMVFLAPGQKKGTDESSAVSDEDLLLRSSGLRISAAGWKKILLVFCLLLFFAGVFKTVMLRRPLPVMLGLAAAFYIYLLFRPSMFLFGRVKSIFRILLEFLAAARRKRLDKDLYSSLVILKNLAIVQKHAPLSADTMLEKLAACASGELRPLYHTLLSMYRTGQTAEAFSSFAASIGTQAGRSAAGLLSKLEKINPAELLEQTEALIDAMREKRVTEGYRNAQKSGMISLALATISILTAMMDLLVVAVYMDLMKMLSEVW